MTGFIVLAVLMFTLAALVARARSYRFPDEVVSFKCKTRWAPAEYAADIRWPASKCRAAWCHDVLIVRRGLLTVQIKPLPVRTPAEPLRELRRREVRGLGREVLCLVLRLDDGSLLEVAAAAHDRTRLVGPFLAVAIPGLPVGPRERKHLGR
jgi:hypothetical protein